MKKLIFTIALAFSAKFSFGQSHVYVNGYEKSNGTYVQPHYRTSPNNTVKDNWSTYPNVNPYTGNTGTKIYSNDTYYKTPFNSSNHFNRPNSSFQNNDFFTPNRRLN